MKDLDLRNVAYTEEYAEYIQSFEWVLKTVPCILRKNSDLESYYWDSSAKTNDTKLCVLGNNEYFIFVEMLAEGSKIVKNFLLHLWKVRISIKDKENNILFEEETFTEDELNILKLIKHKNGSDYIVYRKSLYGYSVFSVAEKRSIDYVPKESFNNKGETFIWCILHYCETNNVLAVDGCYWACPYDFEFYDFTNPMEVPLPFYVSTYDIINSDEKYLRDGEIAFTEKGEVILTIEDIHNKEKENIIIDVTKMKTFPIL